MSCTPRRREPQTASNEPAQPKKRSFCTAWINLGLPSRTSRSHPRITGHARAKHHFGCRRFDSALPCTAGRAGRKHRRLNRWRPHTCHNTTTDLRQQSPQHLPRTLRKTGISGDPTRQPSVYGHFQPPLAETPIPRGFPAYLPANALLTRASGQPI